jgi:hypothetical protein
LKFFLTLALSAAVLTTSPAHASWLSRCFVALGWLPKPKVTKPVVALPAWDPHRLAPPRGDLPLGEKPKLPESDFFEVVALVPDPLVKGRFLYRVRRKPGSKPHESGIEGGETFEQLVRLYPEWSERFGIRFVTVDGIEYLEYPQMEGINARLEKDPRALKFWRDAGNEDTGHLAIARALVDRNEMVLSLKAPVQPEPGEAPAKRSYHFHDMFVHVLGFEAIPPEYMEKTRERLTWLLRIHDDPAFANAEELKTYVARQIREEVAQLDAASASVQRQLEKIPRPPQKFDSFNLFLAYGRLGMGNQGMIESFEQESRESLGLTRAQRDHLRNYFAQGVASLPGDRQADAQKLAERFQAMRKNQ